MIAVLLAFVQLPATHPPVHGIVRDAALGTLVASAQVATRAARTFTAANGTFTIPAQRGDTLFVRRIGYAPVTVVVRDDDATLTIALSPLAMALPATVVSADAAPTPAATSIDVAALDTAAVRSTAEALERLPFVSVRNSRGGVALSMRGSRPEQVLVTLDGIPLNDPATGVADIADIPLAALGSLTAIPGAAGATYGSGASGGVLALTTSARPVLSVYGGSLGAAGASGAVARRAGEIAVRAGGAWSRVTGDFPFRNTVTDPPQDEERVNNDAQHAALFGSLTTPALHVVALASRTDQGLVGPMNVRVFDDARSRTDRALAGAAWTHHALTLHASARLLDYDFRDPPSEPSLTVSRSYDIELENRWVGGALVARAGAGADHVSGDNLRTTTRPRAFAAVAHEERRGPWSGEAALRVDAIRDARTEWSPSLRAAWSGPVRIALRWSQAFRAPTFFDLYFASPQRIVSVPSLRPERVTTDAELSVAWTAGTITASASGFVRRTRDAIVWFPGNFSWSPTNAARERVQGVEARARWTPAGGAELELWGALRSTQLRTREGAVVPTPYVPAADGGASARVALGDVTVSGALRVIGRRPFVVVPDPPPDKELPAVALADLGVAWPLPLRDVHALATLGVRNVANVDWQSVVGYPNARRSWSAGITMQF
ncbi:MAG TPA: TonB-dependent receptor [Gemmatimonadaceae bacterium]|nr:TonB-dependent receptor [Gemmatimonadaceae bacterium]